MTEETTKVRFTTKEAIEAGMPMKIPPPKPIKCQFCQRELYYEGVAVFGIIWIWFDTPERCTCKGAVEFWKIKDEVERQKKLKAEEREAEKKREERYRAQTQRSKMSKRLIQCGEGEFITNSDNEKSHKKVCTYIKTFDKHKDTGNGLYICGTCGTGKTHLAAKIAIDLIRDGVYVIMQPCVDMLREIKASFGSMKTETEVLGEYLECDLLIIDDVGKEQCTEWYLATLYRIVNHRYNQLKPTVITSNYTPDELVKRLTVGANSSSAEAIVSRIRECCAIIEIKGSDYRKTVLTKKQK